MERVESQKNRLSTFPQLLGNLAQTARFPHSHSSGDEAYMAKRRQTARRIVGYGKVEIRNQDSHFPTAPTACGARKTTKEKERQSKRRLHKTLDTAMEFGSSRPVRASFSASRRSFFRLQA
jgi:hypothetical protein